MTTFDPGKHARGGNPENTGQFSTMARGDVDLDRFDDIPDIMEEAGPAPFDLNTVTDHFEVEYGVARFDTPDGSYYAMNDEATERVPSVWRSESGWYGPEDGNVVKATFPGTVTDEDETEAVKTSNFWNGHRTALMNLRKNDEQAYAAVVAEHAIVDPEFAQDGLAPVGWVVARDRESTSKFLVRSDYLDTSPIIPHDGNEHVINITRERYDIERRNDPRSRKPIGTLGVSDKASAAVKKELGLPSPRKNAPAGETFGDYLAERATAKRVESAYEGSKMQVYYCIETGGSLWTVNKTTYEAMTALPDVSNEQAVAGIEIAAADRAIKAADKSGDPAKKQAARARLDEARKAHVEAKNRDAKRVEERQRETDKMLRDAYHKAVFGIENDN